MVGSGPRREDEPQVANSCVSGGSIIRVLDHAHARSSVSAVWRDVIHSQHLIPIMVDHFHSNLACLRSLEGAALGSVELIPGVFVDFCFECFREFFVWSVSAGKISMAHKEALTVVVRVDEPAGDVVSNPFLGEAEMTSGFLVRRVDYGIFNDYLFHPLILSAISAAGKNYTSTGF